MAPSGRGSSASTSPSPRLRYGTSRPNRSLSTTRPIGLRSSGAGSASTTAPGSTARAWASSTNRTARPGSINTLFLRPEWRWSVGRGGVVEFTPKFYTYLSKGENPDIANYRGYVDWRVRHDAGGQWITTAVARVGTVHKGSLLVDMSRRTRDVKVGPLSGYLHLQFFEGYGESILDYNVRRHTQVRLGLAIVP